MSESVLELATRQVGTDPEATLTLLDGCPDSPLALSLRARAERALGRHEAALTSFHHAASLAEASGDALLAVRVRVGEIDSLGMLGRYDEAEELAHQLTLTLRMQDRPVEAAKVMGNLGSLHLRRDRYADALACYEDALSDATTLPLLEAGLHVNAALADTYLGNLVEARTHYERAGALYREHGDAFDAARTEANIGFLEQIAGRHAVAVAMLLPAIREIERAGRFHEVARFLLDLADAYRALNLLPESCEASERALAIFETLPLDDDRARAWIGRASTARRAGRDADAVADLGKALLHFAAQGNAVQMAHVLLLRGGPGDSRAAAQTFRNAGLEGWAAEARLLSAGAESEATLAEIVEVARRTGRGPLECRASHLLGKLLLARGERSEGLKSLRRAVSILESARAGLPTEELHAAYLLDKDELYPDLTDALLTKSSGPHDIAEALLVVERSRSRLLLERVLGALPTLAEALTPELIALRERLSAHYRDTLAEETDEPRRTVGLESRRRLPTLEADYARALREADLSALGDDPALRSRPLAGEALQQALAPDEALICYAALPGRIGAFVVTREQIDAWPDLLPASALSRLTRRFRFHLQKRELSRELRAPMEPGNPEELQEILACLDEGLVRPLRNSLPEKVVLVPGRALLGLPLHALPTLQSREPLYAPSASVWYTLRCRPASPRALPPLLVGLAGPGTEQVDAEIDRLSARFPDACILRGPDATVEAVRSALPGRSLVHFATHALFRRDNPLFSGLQLYDGWLLARDLYGLKLDAELVTLSACQTGAAQPDIAEEGLGLARSFLAVGARRVLASLWSVDDDATTTLMDGFYNRLSREKGSAAGALKEAQAMLQASHPALYDWAAFHLLGSR